MGKNIESPLSISIVDKEDIQKTGLRIKITFSHFIEDAVYFIISFETPAGIILVDPKIHYSYGVIHDMDHFIDSISEWSEWLKKDSEILCIDSYEQYLKNESEKLSIGSSGQLFSVEVIRFCWDEEILIFAMSIYAAKILSDTTRSGCFSVNFRADRDTLAELVEFFKEIKRLYELHEIESPERHSCYKGHLSPLRHDHLLSGKVMTMVKNSESPLTKTNYPCSISFVDKDIQETGLRIKIAFSHFISSAVYYFISFVTPAGIFLIDPKIHYSYGAIDDMDHNIDLISDWLKNDSEKISVGSYEYLFYMEIKRFSNDKEIFLFTIYIDAAKIATDITREGHFSSTMVVDRKSIEELLDFFKEIKRMHKLYKIASPELFAYATDEDNM